MSQTHAMAYRMALEMSPERDTRKSNIQVYKDWDGDKFVVTVLPRTPYPDPDYKALSAYYKASDKLARERWQQKYEEPMPNHVDGAWATTVFASAISYTGPVQLSDEEHVLIARSHHFGDFTVDMLWLTIDGLGWRPGKPVPEDDPGWIAIWAEEELCSSYLGLVRTFLGMPELIGFKHEDIMPSAAKKLYGI